MISKLYLGIYYKNLSYLNLLTIINFFVNFLKKISMRIIMELITVSVHNPMVSRRARIGFVTQSSHPNPDTSSVQNKSSKKKCGLAFMCLLLASGISLLVFYLINNKDQNNKDQLKNKGTDINTSNLDLCQKGITRIGEHWFTNVTELEFSSGDINDKGHLMAYKNCIPEYGYTGSLKFAPGTVNEMYSDWETRKASGFKQRLYVYIGLPGEGLFSVGQGVGYPRLAEKNVNEAVFIEQNADGSFPWVPIYAKGAANIYVIRTLGQEDSEKMVMGYTWDGSKRGAQNEEYKEFGNIKLVKLVESLGLSIDDIKLIRRTGRPDGNSMVISTNQGPWFKINTEGRFKGPAGYFSASSVSVDSENNLKLEQFKDPFTGLIQSAEVERPEINLGNGLYRIVVKGPSRLDKNIFGAFTYGQFSPIGGFPKESDFPEEGFQSDLKGGQVVIQPWDQVGHKKDFILKEIENGDVRTYVAEIHDRGTKFWVAPGKHSTGAIVDGLVANTQIFDLKGVGDDFNSEPNELRSFNLNLWRMGHQQRQGVVESRTLLEVEFPCAESPNSGVTLFNLPECPREESFQCPQPLLSCKVENFPSHGRLNPIDIQSLLEALCQQDTNPCAQEKLKACTDPNEVGKFGNLNAVLRTHIEAGGGCPPYARGSECETSSTCHKELNHIRAAQGLAKGDSYSTVKLQGLFDYLCAGLFRNGIRCNDRSFSTCSDLGLGWLVDHALHLTEQNGQCP